ncbi:MAG TPA: DUF2203 domain-containing protein [Kofleriaceae bacterium]|nr:DUF2203 domain-containing protein [Kofleriaceae bacterium]
MSPEDDKQDDDKQYFTLAEANLSLGLLRELFERVMQLRAQLKTLYGRLENAGHPPREEHLRGSSQVMSTPGSSEMPADVQRDLVLFRGLVETLREQVDEIQATGCVIKDIEVGLVDWPALHHGREVLLCWKYGEREVGWWHDLESGFAGRRPVSELDEDQPQ